MFYRSDTEVVNTLDIPVSVLYMNENDQLSELCKILPNEKYNVPLTVVYGKYQSLFFKPNLDGLVSKSCNDFWILLYDFNYCFKRKMLTPGYLPAYSG